MPVWPNVVAGTQQNEIMDWLHAGGPGFAPTTVEIADMLGFEKDVSASGRTIWPCVRARSALDILERKGLVERVGKGRRGAGGGVKWRKVDVEPLRDFAADHEEHLLSHKVQSVRFRRLEDRVVALEKMIELMWANKRTGS